MRSTRRAKLHLNVEQVAQILDLPAGVHVRAMQALVDPPAVIVVLEGEGLPEIPEDQEAPIVWAETVVEFRRRYRWPQEQS